MSKHSLIVGQGVVHRRNRNKSYRKQRYQRVPSQRQALPIVIPNIRDTPKQEEPEQESTVLQQSAQSRKVISEQATSSSCKTKKAMNRLFSNYANCSHFKLCNDNEMFNKDSMFSSPPNKQNIGDDYLNKNLMFQINGPLFSSNFT